MTKTLTLAVVLTTLAFTKTVEAQQPASAAVVPLEQRVLPVKKKSATLRSVQTMDIKPAAKRATAVTRKSPVTTHKHAKKASK